MEIVWRSGRLRLSACPLGIVRVPDRPPDLIYTFGWALWTGAVVVVFVQIWPEAKRRQFKQALDAYEAAVGDQARAGSGQAPDAVGAGEGGQVPPE